MSKIWIILVLGLLASAAQGAQEQLNLGLFSFSFDLNVSGDYNITGSDDLFRSDILISGQDGMAQISSYLEPGLPIPELGQEERNIWDILIELGIADAEPYFVDIGGREGLMGVANNSQGNLIFVASSTEYLEDVKGSLNTEVISDFPWQNGTESLLGSLSVKYDPTLNETTSQKWNPDKLLYKGYITFSDDDGQSPETAIKVENAYGEWDGVSAEYYYLDKRFGQKGTDWDLELQSLVSQDNSSYDKMDLNVTASGPQTLYFDVTDFLGKYL